MTPLERIVAARTGGGVRRCHGIRHRGEYRVDGHSWSVMVIIYVLWPEHFAYLAPYAMVHDVPEAWVGDIPAPTKRYSKPVKDAVQIMESQILCSLDFPDDSELPLFFKTLLKAADHLELYMWAKEQVSEGNRHALSVIRELDQFFQESGLPERARDLYETLRDTEITHSTSDVIRDMHRGE